MASKPAYEDFQPPTERKDDDPENTILLVHIPGFAKEQIKITYVHLTRKIKVQGERPVDISGGIWKRFNQEFQVPENCVVEKIHAKFQNGVLTVTLPKQIVSTAAPPKEQQQGQEAPREEQKERIKKLDDEPKKEAIAAAPAVAAAAAPAAGDIGEKKDKAKQEDEIAEKVKDKESAKKEKEEEKSDAGRENKVGQKKGQQKEEEYCKLTAAAAVGKRRDVKEMAAAAMKTVKTGLSMERKDDRQLLVNVGVAVLVIVAIGAFVTYKIRSKSKN